MPMSSPAVKPLVKAAPAHAGTASSERDRAVQRFAEIIRSGRRVLRAGDSQTAFAQRIGVSRSTLQRMEAGDAGVSLDAWMRAWQALGMMRSIALAVTPSDTMAIASAAAVAAHAARRHPLTDVSTEPVEFPVPAPRVRAPG